MTPATKVLLYLSKHSSPLEPLDPRSKNALSHLEGSSHKCCCSRSRNGYCRVSEGPCQPPGTIPTEMAEGVSHTPHGYQPLHSWNVTGILLNATRG